VIPCSGEKVDAGGEAQSQRITGDVTENSFLCHDSPWSAATDPDDARFVTEFQNSL